MLIVLFEVCPLIVTHTDIVFDILWSKTLEVTCIKKKKKEKKGKKNMKRAYWKMGDDPLTKITLRHWFMHTLLTHHWILFVLVGGKVE